jgi:hypothetical protein
MEAAVEYLTETLLYDDFYKSLGVPEIELMMEFVTDNLCDIASSDGFLAYREGLYSINEVSISSLMNTTKEECELLYESGLTKGFKFFQTKFRSDVAKWDQ